MSTDHAAYSYVKASVHSATSNPTQFITFTSATTSANPSSPPTPPLSRAYHAAASSSIYTLLLSLSAGISVSMMINMILSQQGLYSLPASPLLTLLSQYWYLVFVCGLLSSCMLIYRLTVMQPVESSMLLTPQVRNIYKNKRKELGWDSDAFRAL